MGRTIKLHCQRGKTLPLLPNALLYVTTRHSREMPTIPMAWQLEASPI
uniref:Uncharacterized protein n=1 Tax=Rhizophora mucronata TaxID=61149 RepID=A0A2P2QZ22_RHIMU